MYSKRILFYLRGKRKKKREGQRGWIVRRRKKKETEFGLVNRLIIFNLFIKRPFSNVTKKLKTGINEFSKYMF